MTTDFAVSGRNQEALFNLKLYRGDGMVLIAMNWKTGEPPDDFVGFEIQYREPGGTHFLTVGNRIAFPTAGGALNPATLSSKLSPIQKFRWVHFPFNADLPGEFTYSVSPVFMDADDKLRYGSPQTAQIALSHETVPGQINVSFTRGFVNSQAFVDTYAPGGAISTLLPAKAKTGLDFTPTHPQAAKALAWMGFEARQAILDVLDRAIADTSCEVRVIAYDLNEPEVVTRLEQLGSRLAVIIDDSADHGDADAAETAAAARLATSAGAHNVRRQHMGQLQHNKTITVSGPVFNAVVCGSTNLSWRGFYVQSNNAVVLSGAAPAAIFRAAFDAYWNHSAAEFGTGAATAWQPLGLQGIDAAVTFSPHASATAVLDTVAHDIEAAASSVFYSLAFLSQTHGAILEAVEAITENDALFVYGISDRKVGGLSLHKPNGSIAPVFASALSAHVPPPFSAEPTGGGGTRMHHKFVVVDFNTDNARVYFGSYNFSTPADRQNGENLLLVRDRRVATAYMVEALRIFDHYHFRVAAAEAARKQERLVLAKPPRTPDSSPWWREHYVDPAKIRDRELFA